MLPHQDHPGLEYGVRRIDNSTTRDRVRDRQSEVASKSYAIILAGTGAAIFVANSQPANRGTRDQPRDLRRAVQWAPATGLPAMFSQSTSTGYLLERTSHVQINSVQTFGCGALHSLSGYCSSATYAATISDQYVGRLRMGENGAETVVAVEKQP
jgi:hypothetical protein